MELTTHIHNAHTPNTHIHAHTVHTAPHTYPKVGTAQESIPR